VPAGQYAGDFVSVEPMEPKPEQKYGPGLCWTWIIVGGAYDGQTATRVTGDSPTGKNAAGRMFRAITGADPRPGVEIDFEQFVGKRFTLLIADAPQGGGTRVESCVATPVEAAL
jgi:hypothetical protein